MGRELKWQNQIKAGPYTEESLGHMNSFFLLKKTNKQKTKVSLGPSNVNARKEVIDNAIIGKSK